MMMMMILFYYFTFWFTNFDSLSWRYACFQEFALSSRSFSVVERCLFPCASSFLSSFFFMSFSFPPPLHKQAHKSCLWQVFFPALGSMVQHSLGSTCKPSSFQQEELFQASIFSDLLCVSKKQNFKKATNHVHFCGFTWIVLYYRKSYYPPFSHHNNNFISRE
jgi:hypothetical protein